MQILGVSPWLQVQVTGPFRLPLESTKMQSLQEESAPSIKQGVKKKNQVNCKKFFITVNLQEHNSKQYVSIWCCS